VNAVPEATDLWQQLVPQTLSLGPEGVGQDAASQVQLIAHSGEEQAPILQTILNKLSFRYKSVVVFVHLQNNTVQLILLAPVRITSHYIKSAT
jgi:hypothetical protein